MVKIINGITSPEVDNPYLRLCAGILKKAVVDARGGDKEGWPMLPDLNRPYPVSVIIRGQKAMEKNLLIKRSPQARHRIKIP
jgi:hypothetical protein